MDAPPGLTYVPDFLAVDEERSLLERLSGWTFDQWQEIRFRGRLARRRKVAYGWNYEPGAREVTPAPPLPDFLKPLRERCAAEAGEDPGSFRQATVTWYPKGAAIGKHRDAPYFGPVVVGVSLGADAEFVFRRGDRKYPLEMKRRSLLVLSGDARARWTHEMKPVREERYSIYFRSLRRSEAVA